MGQTAASWRCGIGHETIVADKEVGELRWRAVCRRGPSSERLQVPHPCPERKRLQCRRPTRRAPHHQRHHPSSVLGARVGLPTVVARVRVGVCLAAIGVLCRLGVERARVSHGDYPLLDLVAGLVVRSTSVDCVLVIDTSADGEAFDQTVAHLDWCVCVVSCWTPWSLLSGCCCAVCLMGWSLLCWLLVLNDIGNKT